MSADDRTRTGTLPFDTAAVSGLGEAEAAARLAAEGPNELPSQRPRGLAAIAAEVAREPMFVLLVAAGLLYLLTGKPSDALMLLGFVLLVMTITIVQERRTERVLDALRDLSSPRALVLREGVARRIPGRDVVRGDLVIVAEGDRVPADGLLRRATHVSVDESLLTGEPVPVRKQPSAGATALDAPGGEDLASVYSGTVVTAGQGLVEVLRTGTGTELGRIGRSLRGIAPEATPLQQETRRVVRMLALCGGVACAIVIVAYGLTRGGSLGAWREGLLAGIAMAMAILPEEFPVVLTVFLALGAWRISRSHVLTRRMPAIETLGAATVLCVDKTGTLTENRMTVRRVVTPLETATVGPEPQPCPAGIAAVLVAAAQASHADPFDPMERALHRAAAGLAADVTRGTLRRQYPLSTQLLAVSHVYDDGATDVLGVCSKGAPEAIATLCRLGEAERAAALADVAALAGEGLRVLAVARGEITGEPPDEHAALRLRWLGLVGLEDPLRANVPAAVAECRDAGVRVVMITGDYPATAQAIARQAGLAAPERTLTGTDLERLDEEELARRIGSTQVYARVVPEQKLRIVTALKAQGEVVAMTGDGVNDAPALRAAHIGIAMGGRGTDVAREAASVVLLDDDFSSIVAAVRLGRRIYDNIRKAAGFILAVHVPIVGLSMIPVLVPGWPLLLLPVHIAFLQLIIDPACSLVYEAEAPELDVMRRPPRPRDQRLFSREMVLLSVLHGLSVLVVCLAIYALAGRGHAPDAARALVFTSLVASFVTMILVTRSWHRSAWSMLREPNPAAWWITTGAIALLGLVLGLPAASRLFHFAPVTTDDAVASLVAGVLCLGWFELLKHSQRWRARSRRRA